MGHNLAPTSLNRDRLSALPSGTAVIDRNMDIYIKREHTMWEAETGRKITLSSLFTTKHKPIRCWKGPVR